MEVKLGSYPTDDQVARWRPIAEAWFAEQETTIRPADIGVDEKDVTAPPGPHLWEDLATALEVHGLRPVLLNDGTVGVEKIEPDEAGRQVSL